MFCSNKENCINPNQGNLTEKDFSLRKDTNKLREQCKICLYNNIKKGNYNYSFCVNLNCQNPKNGNLKREDYRKNSVECKYCRTLKQKFKSRELRDNPIIKFNIGFKSKGYKIQGENFTYSHFLILLEKQNGVCSICKRAIFNKRTERLCVDHNHKTNEVRGLLCLKCNQGIGSFEENKEFLNGAIKYLTLYEGK